MHYIFTLICKPLTFRIERNCNNLNDISHLPSLEIFSEAWLPLLSLQCRHDDRDGVSNHWRLDCWLKRLFRRTSKKTSKLRFTGLCDGNSTATGEFPAQKASNAENFSIWWRHHDGKTPRWKHNYAALTLGPVSLRLMTSQFKDIVTHTQKYMTVKCTFYGVWVQNFVWNFKGALWNFTQNFEAIHRKICILWGGKNLTTYDILELWHLKS